MMVFTRSLSRPARRWITALALLAFFLQSLVIQTHVHQLLQPAAAKVLAGGTHKTPGKPDPMDHCRLCQELAHAGNFVTPSAAIAFVGLSSVPAIFAALALSIDPSATAFTWQSRAPPRR